MKLPYAEHCYVAEAKITLYLLNLNHPKGGTKAVFFMAFGFIIEKWEVMVSALQQHAMNHEVVDVKQTPHCMSYSVDGEISSPDGRNPHIRSVWCIKHGETIPMLVTAYPTKYKEVRDETI